MNLLTLAVLCICLGSCSCLEFPAKLSIDDNGIVLLVLATFGTISLIGACAFCFRKKKTFEKLENESGSPENLKKNEYPIFRALATDVTESSAIVPCERNNLSRDNLLNSSDNLTTPDHLPPHHHDESKLDAVDSSDVVVLLDKSQSQRDRLSRDTLTFETEKKHQQHSPSSKTPLLYAKNVQSYHEQPPINEQIQQKSNLLAHCENTSSFEGFYNIREESVKDEIDDFINSNKSSENAAGTSSSVINPFFNSTSEEFQSIKEVIKDDTSEIESSINDNSEKYQILEEETDGEEIKIDDSPAIKPIRKNSDISASEDKSVEEALKALDLAIGFDDDDEDEENENQNEVFEENINRLDTIKEEATFLVDSIVNDCEKILEDKQKEDNFEDFIELSGNNMSTPCAAGKTTKLFKDSQTIDIAKVLFPGGVDLTEGINDETFPIMNETYEVNDKTFDAAPQQLPAIKIEKDKDEVSSEDLTTVTPVNTPIELSYSSETWDKMSYTVDTSKGAISKIPKQPEPQKEEPTFNQDGWYLHPPNSSMKNDTFDIYCDEEEIDEGNMEDMSSTFDQLRRQLTEMLPHAQGMSVHNDFMDDDDDLTRNKDSSSPSDNMKYDEATNAGSFDLLGAILNPEPVAEININYHNTKRPLSPILEESECDETCRTFVFNNETKLLDSTSTGIMESASASDAGQMGQMPKALMASNDTLFNFEDTLSDQTDNLLMSPRMNTAGSSTSSTLSRQESHDRISNERTPTNEDMPKIGEFNAIDIVKKYPLSLDLNPTVIVESTKYEMAKAALEEGSWPLELPEAQQIVNDLSSPEQNRTADSLSFEQDITYTIDDQKTCVSLVLKNDEERISEISEPLFASDALDMFGDDASSLQIDDAISLEIDDNCNLEMNDENGNQNGATKEIELHLNETSSLNYDNDSINPREYEIDSLEPEAKILNEDIEADSIPASHATKSIYSADSINDDDMQQVDTVQSNETSESNSIASPQKRPRDSSEDSDLSNDAENKKKVPSSISLTSSSGKLTTLQDYLFNEVFYANENGCGCSPKEFQCNYQDFENDPWGSPDIRQVSCNNAMMSTSFTKEWSDDDSSHSSEEFMYVKGTIEVEKIVSPTDNEKSTQKEEEPTSGEQKSSAENENMDVEDLAAEHSENASKPNEIEVHSEDDESAEESEFIPSCWEPSLQPSKSSLKSPEREGSVEQQPVKARRRVAFKIQRYHSVYEYPSEVVQLSPAYSEPQLWSNYDYSGNIDFFTYTNPLADLADNFDGFSVSSSSRPFHNNTHNIQIHNTWPNESTDFSWSQYQDSDGSKFEDTPSTSKIEWPSREDDSGCMCESSDSPNSMGELNHHKNSLRLPLELISSTCSEVSDFMSTTDVITKDLDAVKIEIDESPKPNTIINIEDDDVVLVDEEDDEKLNDSILPTPLSGSIDSLSSNSHSASTNNSSPPSFTTFGKESMKESEMSGKTQTIIFIEEDVTKLTRIDSQKKGKNEAIEKSGKGGVLLQSSDDDSGFENVVQIKCEK